VPARLEMPIIGTLAILVVTGLLLLLTAQQAPAAVSTSHGTPAPTLGSAASLEPSAPASAEPAQDQRPPRPASRSRKAKRVPERPRDNHHGKRLVYDKALMTVWMMDAQDNVVARYPVVGRFDRPLAGKYHIFSKSKTAVNPNSKVTFHNMMRFTYGPDTKSPIGFHSIPRYYDGRRMHSTKQLGLAIAAGGCVRLSEKASKALYKFMDVGDLVVVLPSP